jgi:hypothetical protein
VTTREAIEARHVRKPAGVDWCGVCDVAWPCDTAQLLALLREAEAREARLREAISTMPTARVISQWDLVSRKAVLALFDPEATDD